MHGMDTDEELVYWRERAERAEVKLIAVAAARDEACELAEEGWAYAGDYFRDKWKFAEQVAELRKVGHD